MSGILSAQNLEAGYGRTAVVHGVDLEVDAGEVVALLGPNGAGKTTTLLTMAGVMRPMAGSVVWQGSTRFTPLYRRAREGMQLVTERSVIMQLDVEANLKLGRGDPDTAYEIFPQLRPLRSRRAGLLSGGEQRMLAMARALAAEPTVLLLDEVSLGLAPLIAGRLLSEARNAAARGVAVVLVEQQVNRALDVADRCYVLRRGQVVLEGTTEEIGQRLDQLEEAYVTSHR
jgi:branched-chain amino acid transport system ATP-binding protein